MLLGALDDGVTSAEVGILVLLAIWSLVELLLALDMAALVIGAPDPLLFCEQEHSAINSTVENVKAMILFIIFMFFILASTIICHRV